MSRYREETQVESRPSSKIQDRAHYGKCIALINQRSLTNQTIVDYPWLTAVFGRSKAMFMSLRYRANWEFRGSTIKRALDISQRYRQCHGLPPDHSHTRYRR